MIWVEVLSRHRDIAARFRIAAPEARIGRGYDNDVIIDDPYVAAQHLRVFRDEAGQLIAEDLGSTNGTFLDGGRSRVARIVVDGKHPIRIGQTYLRIREIHHEVERERVAPLESRTLPIAAAATLGASLLALSVLQIWLGQTAELRASSYLTPLLWIVATVLVWAGIWALLSRVFSGSSHLLRNLLITLAGGLAFSLYHEFARIFAFAWTWPGASTYQYVATWSILAAMCFLHLREVGRTRLKLKGAIVVALLVTAIAFQTLQRSEAFSDYGRQYTTHQLMPPAFRAVQLTEQSVFFGEIANLKARLDSDRVHARPNEAVQ
ncbi:pSer/pThr/pTyr-binding forkhead associated (FHA) protein [Bradyrhizobium sp. AZCC 1588]|uniref:FHA domain-containing protein n=1 Tax=unclassified Bradyrhizobium TaxID=2631580 RepID=UPI002FF28484